MREKGPKLIILAFDTHDLQLAITQILLRNGWEQTSLGKIVRKIKQPFSNTAAIYILDMAKDGRLVVRDREGRVTARVDLNQIKTTEQVMEAAQLLHSGAAKKIFAKHQKQVGGSVDTKKIARVASALKQAAGLGAYGGSNVRDYFRDGLDKGDSVHHEESGIKAKRRFDKRLPTGWEYELQHPDGKRLSFDHDELNTLAERASMWADRVKNKK